MTARYALGIDLGTTNSVLAYAPLGTDQPVQLLSIPQVVDDHTVESLTSLASFSYLPADEAHDRFKLPWGSPGNYCVGEFARRQAADAPEHTVTAAKSWLSSHQTDRRAAFLPWQAGPGVEKISPVVASQRYLEHLIAAWSAAFPDAPIGDQRVVLTVPASFDTVARELTREAALAAGLPENVVLLEEPQAAIYAWLARSGDGWRQAMSVGDQLLVVDIGGGTTDLTLVSVEEQDGELSLERIAVGNHLLVGGDNMDLTLAHSVAEQFAAKGVKLDAWQSISLWHACRKAKETLLADEGPTSHTVSVLGRGTKLIGGTVSVEVERDHVASLLVDGFFPRCNADEGPERRHASGFQEIGLPYESDTAVTRHIAAFLSHHPEPNQGVRHVVFNGGVFKSHALQERMMSVLNSWTPDTPTNPLMGVRDLDHAVAIGACHYVNTLDSGGIRIRGGVARSYYVGIETAGLAIPGAPRPLNALCVVPFGMEEGTQVDVPSNPIGLVHGEPAEFRFFSSATRPDDQPGDLLRAWEETELIETSSLQATLPADDSVTERFVPVTFQSRITELGMCELWCVSTQSEGQWKLEFNARAAGEESDLG